MRPELFLLVPILAARAPVTGREFLLMLWALATTGLRMPRVAGASAVVVVVVCLVGRDRILVLEVSSVPWLEDESMSGFGVSPWDEED